MMTDEESLGRICQILSDRGKTLKFTEIVHICEFCEHRDDCKKFTALVMRYSSA